MGRIGLELWKEGVAKTMLKEESLQSQRADDMEILCWHWIPPGLKKGVSCVPVFGRKLLGQSRKFGTEIRGHVKATRKGWMGRGAMPGGGPSTLACGWSLPWNRRPDAVLTHQTHSYYCQSCFGSWFPRRLKRDLMKPGGEGKKEKKCVRNHQYGERGGGEEEGRNQP